jgi:outer membrane biosynthesis protein TonB
MTAIRRNDELEARWTRVWRAAMIASLLLHVVLFLLLYTGLAEPLSPFAAAGPRSGDDRAAAGGGMETISMRIQLPEAPQPIPRPPEPLPAPAEEVVEVEPEEQAVEAQPDAPEGPATQVATTGRGTDAGPGLEGATGRGDGGTAEEGRFRVVPPSPRGLILPPSNRPGRVRGKEVAVWVFVTDRGRVLPDSTRVLPSTGDRGFDRRLREQAAEWVFEPAKKGGRAVAEWFRYTIVL